MKEEVKVMNDSSDNGENGESEPLVNEIDIPSDEQLNELISKNHTVIPNFEISSTCIFDCSVDKLFELCFDNGAKLPFTQYWIDKVPTSNQKQEDWREGCIVTEEELKNASELDYQKILMSRKGETDIVMFKQSHLVKLWLLVERQPSLIKMRVFNIISGMVASDCFNPEEEWIIESTEAEAPRCVVRHCAFINFHRYSMMQSVVKSKGLSSQKDNFKNWCAWVKSLIGHHYDAQKVHSDIREWNEKARDMKSRQQQKREGSFMGYRAATNSLSKVDRSSLKLPLSKL
mmetsp:Transcript_18481/g.31632  ORF Transcript_18481/g.31632 Transcript_18481/m.31632 type:complete len:288 (+) Transcript_18481:1020-1883(+)